MKHSLEGKLALLSVALVAVAIATCGMLVLWFQSPTIAVLGALIVAVPIAILFARWFMGPIRRTLEAVSDGIGSMRDRDFSVSITPSTDIELRALVASYNGLGQLLRDERQSLYQRELLLDTVIQATPLAMVLTNAGDRVVYSNLAARQAFLGGRKLEGLAFAELLCAAPEPLRRAVAGEADTLFTVETEGESEIYHLSQRGFLLNSQTHRLYLLKQLTRELSRQEVETWKKVIRVIAHELNNSLAPISSLAHSGRQLVERKNATQHATQMDRIFRTIEERARHLHTFIDGYARFAKLPQPAPEEVNWSAFLHALQEAAPFRLLGEPPTRSGVFDATQMEQVIINLVKNAREAGAPADSIELQVTETNGGWQLQVMDRGSGMTDEVLRNALLPFYSTKPAGAGLGLTVCREVIEAHGGRISLANRAEGGLVATLWIPALAAPEG
ncbi:MAG: ATP-binding protein [Steroidobacteraceae bacterium]